METVAYHIGELEAAMNARSWPIGQITPFERLLRIEDAARNLITAWDAENSPERDHSGYSISPTPRRND